MTTMTHHELLEDYFFNRALRARTERSYRQAVTKLCKNISYPLNELDRQHVLEWRKRELSEGLSPISWNTYVRHLRALINHGMNRGLLAFQENPFSGMNVRAPDKRKKTLSRREIEAARLLLDRLEQEELEGDTEGRLHPVWFWRTTFETFYYTGIRLNQLLHLRVKDIDLDHALLHIRIEGSKSWREYSVPIPADLYPWLARLLQESHECGMQPNEQAFNINRLCLPFQRYTRQIMNTDQLEICYTDLSARLGFKVSPHRFRHTLATDLMRAPEANLHVVKEILGHTNLSTTLQYVTADQNSMRRALEQR